MEAAEIRALQEGDSVAELTALLHAAYGPLAAMGFRYVASSQGEEVTQRRLRRGFPLVAKAGGVLVGTITLYAPQAESHCGYYRRDGVYSFGQFAVQPGCQRGGLGRKLVERVEQEAGAHGAEELALDTAEGAVHLQEWYARLGFRLVEHVSWPDTNYRSVVMAKRLAGFQH